MELERRDYRAIIYFCYKRNVFPEEALEELHVAFEGSAPSKSTVYNWYAEFRRGRTSLSDEDRSGRPISAVSPENVAAVRQMVREDARVTYTQIEQTLGITSASVYTILHDKLSLRKVSARWIPHLLTEDQKEARINFCKFMLEKFDGGKSKRVYDIVTGDETWIYRFDPESKRQSSVWVFPEESAPQKCRRSRSVGKKMVASFFSLTGHVATVPLEDRKTVNADWYVNVCVPQVFAKWSQRRPKTGTRGLLWHHDNASAHTAARTVEFFDENSVRRLPHPPYSPDLAPCDFFLFPYVKDKLRGVKFDSSEAAIDAYLGHISDIPREKWLECFQMWFYRMQRCIACHGEYFEKM